MVLRIIDIETTGVDPEKDAIIEIASVDLVRVGLTSGESAAITFDIQNEQEHLVNPGREIPPEATAVHHIMDIDVHCKPFLADVLPHYKGADFYIAHNSLFEESFLHEFLGGPKWIDTYRCALRVWPEAPGHSNQVLRYWLGFANPFGRHRNGIDPHRALSDCIVTAAILARLIEKASWADLQRWSSEPALFTTFSFGKHKGDRWDAHPNYLDWIINKSDFDENTKWCARYWLDNRRQAA